MKIKTLIGILFFWIFILIFITGCKEVNSFFKSELFNKLIQIKKQIVNEVKYTPSKEESLSEIQSKYQLLRTELFLAETGKVYLTINIPERKLELRLKGAKVWQTPLNIVEGDLGILKKFQNRFSRNGERWRLPVVSKYLFAYQDKMPDSVLAIVSEVLNVKKELLQREVPERFRIYWSDDLIMDIVTDVSGQSRSFFKNKIVEAHTALRRPFGATQLVVKTPPDKALTLYRIAGEGLETLLIPDNK